MREGTQRAEHSAGPSPPQAAARHLGPSTAAPKRTTLILLGWAGAVLGAAMLFVDRPWWDARALHFAETPEFALYATLVGAYFASTTMASVFVISAVRDLWE